MDFCKSFNDKTKDFKDSTPIPVEITAFSDRTFEYTIKTPQTTYLIKQAVMSAMPESTPEASQLTSLNAGILSSVSKHVL